MVTDGAKENRARIGEFCRDERGRDFSGCLRVIGDAVLCAAQEDVARGEATDGGEKLSVWGAKRKGDSGFGAGCHELRTGTDVPTESDDALEVVERDAEQRFAIVPDVHGGTVFGEVGFFFCDEEGVEVGFHAVSRELFSCWRSQADAEDGVWG